MENRKYKSKLQLKSLSKRRMKPRKYYTFTEDRLLLESAKTASSKAVRSSTALGITIKVIENNNIIAINPDQTRRVLRTISKSKIDTSSLKEGMILERK